MTLLGAALRMASVVSILAVAASALILLIPFALTAWRGPIYEIVPGVVLTVRQDRNGHVRVDDFLRRSALPKGAAFQAAARLICAADRHEVTLHASAGHPRLQQLYCQLLGFEHVPGRPVSALVRRPR